MMPKAIAGKPVPAVLRTDLVQIVNAAIGCFKRELTISLKTSDPKTAKVQGAVRPPV